jgi:urease beta subunit
VIPGEIELGADPVALCPERARRTVLVLNTGDRPIQVGSHFHFADVNRALEFDRVAAAGSRLDIPAGSSVRFEPGVQRTIALVALGGHKHVPGLQLK